MRILIDARLYGLEHAGLGRYTLNLIEELKDLGKEENFIVLLRKKYFNQLRLPKNWKKVLADFSHYSVKEQVMLPTTINRQKPDLVHFPHLNVPIFYKGNYVVTIHDLIMHKSKGKMATTLPFYKYFIKRFGYLFVFRKAVLGSRKIIVPSISIKDEVVEYYHIDKSKVLVTYEGVDKNICSRHEKREILKKYKLLGKYFIYVGNAYPHKNLNRAVEAVASVNQKSNANTSLAIVSSRNVFRKRLQDLVKRKKAEKYVKLLGFVPDEDLSILLKNSVAFIYASLDEGFGLQGLESITAGTLVIASDIPVFREIYKDNVFYFDPYDVLDIAKAMRKVMKINDKERERIIKKGQKFIKRYSWSRMAKQTLEIYKQAENKFAVDEVRT